MTDATTTARANLAAHAARLFAQALHEWQFGSIEDGKRLLHRAAQAEIASKRHDAIGDWLEALAEDADWTARAREKSHSARAHAVAVAGEQLGSASMAGAFERCQHLRDLVDKAVRNEKIERRLLHAAERARHAARHRYVTWACGGGLV